MTNDEGKTERKFDLEERTSSFAEDIIDFVKQLPNDPKFLSIITQLIRSATSVGANYCERTMLNPKKILSIK